MRTGLWLGLFLIGAAGSAPFMMQAQMFSHHSCGGCQMPVQQCHCQRTRPIVQTHLREEKAISYRNVMETRYRQECVMEQTPVTAYEDRVETVWVPQQVTRKVAKTVMVPQARARVVPYQVMTQVPQVTSRMVPYQTVQHVTEAVPVTMMAPPVIQQGCNTCGSSFSSAAVPYYSAAALPPAYSMGVPQTAVAIPHRAPPLAPTAVYPGGWQTIPSRSAASDRFGGYEPGAEAPVPTPIDTEPAVRKSTWRGNVPGAASAWNFNERSYH